MTADRWKQRVDAGDWAAITAEVNEYGGALLPELLTAAETKQIRDLYEDDKRFRHRFGEGEYRRPCAACRKGRYREWQAAQRG